MQTTQTASPEAKPINEKRQVLKSISAAAKMAVKFGKADSVNEAIIDIYKAQGIGNIFKSFHDWAKDGYSIKKGEKALLVWGRPRTKKQDDQGDGYSFFPVAFVFSDLQVIQRENKADSVGEPSKKYGCSEIEVSYKSSEFIFSLDQVSNSRQAYEILKPFYKSIEHHECFYVLLLNHRAKPIGVFCTSVGGMAATIVDVRIVMQTALKCHAATLIISHNHPSGNLQPSEQDIKLTKKLKEAGQFLDIPIRDHLILTEQSYYSFADEGNL